MTDKRPVEEFLDGIATAERVVGWRLSDDGFTGGSSLYYLTFKTEELALDAAVALAREVARLRKAPRPHGGQKKIEVEDGAGGTMKLPGGPPGAELEFRQREVIEDRPPDSTGHGVYILWDVRIVQPTRAVLTVEVEGKEYSREEHGKNVLRDWFPLRSPENKRLFERRPAEDVRTEIRVWIEPVEHVFACRRDPAEQEARRC